MNALIIDCQVCGSHDDVRPYYTKKIKDLKKGEKQPEWFCKKHKPRKVVSPV